MYFCEITNISETACEQIESYRDAQSGRRNNEKQSCCDCTSVICLNDKEFCKYDRMKIQGRYLFLKIVGNSLKLIKCLFVFRLNNLENNYGTT